MRVLLVGGAGGVGSAMTPYLLEAGHEVRVLDLAEPAHDVEFIHGSITDVQALTSALQDMDCFIDLVMRSPQGGHSTEQTVEQIVANYEVNTLGVHLLLYHAYQQGIRCGIYTSTISVHYRNWNWYPSEEAVPLNSPSVYGLTKGFGELICEYFARWFDMNLLALRITGPRTTEQWLAERATPIVHQTKLDSGNLHAEAGGRTTVDLELFVTSEQDLARAYLSALEAVQIGHARFDAVLIAGDEDEVEHNLSKARRLLGWAPTRYTPAASAEETDA